MEPIEFPEVNSVLAKDQPEYRPLPVHNAGNQVISCWKLSPSEVELIGRTKKIFLSQMNFGKPPMPLFLAVSKKEMFNNCEEQIEEPISFGIHHKATIKFGFWECLRILFGKPAIYSATINIDRQVSIINSPNGYTYVPQFKKRIFSRHTNGVEMLTNKPNK